MQNATHSNVTISSHDHGNPYEAEWMSFAWDLPLSTSCGVDYVQIKEVWYGDVFLEFLPGT